MPDNDPALVEKKHLAEPLPHFVVMVLPYDPETKKAALLWRGEGVRSAKNCMSAPSGLLEHGESFESGIVRELYEELGVAELPENCSFHTVYRSINGDGFDWVIGVWSLPVYGLAERVKNMEPDKHDAIVLADLRSFFSIDEFRRAQHQVVDGKLPDLPINFSPKLFPVLRRVATQLVDEIF